MNNSVMTPAALSGYRNTSIPVACPLPAEVNVFEREMKIDGRNKTDQMRKRKHLSDRRTWKSHSGGYRKEWIGRKNTGSVQKNKGRADHVDHVQNTAYLKKALGVPVALHMQDLDLIKDNAAEPLHYQGFLGMVVAEVSEKSYESDRIPEFSPEFFLKEGDRLKDYGINARIMELPGHTKGSIGIDIDGKSVIVGDALMNMFYPGLSMVYWDRGEMIKSAEKISALGARKVYFGHGSPVENRAWNRAGI